jgi:hypothetical protein
MNQNNKTYNFRLGGLYPIFAFCTAMIGYTIHNSVGWSILDFLFAPVAWMKWLVMHQVNITIIKETFSFFIQ